MTDKYRIFRRASGMWYIEDRETHHQSSLRTQIEAEAKRLLQAKNEAQRHGLARQISNPQSQLA